MPSKVLGGARAYVHTTDCGLRTVCRTVCDNGMGMGVSGVMGGYGCKGVSSGVTLVTLVFLGLIDGSMQGTCVLPGALYYSNL